MTVPAENPRTVHTSDGATLVWLIGFELIGVDTFGSRGAYNIRVFTEEPQVEEHPIYGTVDGSEELIRDIDYTVDVDTGEIELVEEVPDGYSIAIIRDTFVTQECAYHELSRYLMDGSIEYPLDKITHRLQELTDLEARLVKWLASAEVQDFSWFPVGTYFPARLSVNNDDGTYDFVEIVWDGENDVWIDLTDGRTGEAQEANGCPCVEAGVNVIIHVMRATDGSPVFRFRAALCDDCNSDHCVDCTGDQGIPSLVNTDLLEGNTSHLVAGVFSFGGHSPIFGGSCSWSWTSNHPWPQLSHLQIVKEGDTLKARIIIIPAGTVVAGDFTVDALPFDWKDITGQVVCTGGYLVGSFTLQSIYPGGGDNTLIQVTFG